MAFCKIFIFILFWLLPFFAQAGNGGRVTVLLSSDEKIFLKPLATFQAGIADKVQTLTLQGDINRDARLMDRLLKERPSLIFALGAKAAYIAKIWTKGHQDVPVLFAMVLNWEQYHLLEGQSNIVGISNEVAPGNQFLSLSIFSPDIRQIGVIYNPSHSAAIVRKAREAADLLGLKLIERPIDDSRDFRRTYRQLVDQIDGMWILSDPVTYTLDNMSWLSKRCVKDRLVCVGQGINLTEVGMLLSVRADIAGIGSQAASIAKNILNRHQSPASVGVMPPLGTQISFNQHTADSLGIIISSQAMNMVNELIE